MGVQAMAPGTGGSLPSQFLWEEMDNPPGGVWGDFQQSRANMKFEMPGAGFNLGSRLDHVDVFPSSLPLSGVIGSSYHVFLGPPGAV